MVEKSMKTVTSFALNLAAAALIVIASASIAAAGNDVCIGLDATIGGTCTPLTNITSDNTGSVAIGLEALFSNTTGNQNTAVGVEALQANTTGQDNTATGLTAMLSNTTGVNNAATGAGALIFNTTGSFNTAGGNNALTFNTTGSSNIGIGNNAGDNLTTGDNNIDIGNEGVKAEANTIRIGAQGTQTATFIAGIFGGPTIKKGCEVVANSSGLLGSAKSSARYKRDIHDMGDASDKLMKLRPVTFQYKEDSDGIRQYGLIAEEVEKVYPELVIDGIDGKAETVEYQVLPAMLLNEVQKQSRQLARKDAQIVAMHRQMASQQKQLDALAERLDALEGQARASRPDRLAAALR
jgi:uncharacterized coiled-coil protein SlyX